jgi:hypothetical protein
VSDVTLTGGRLREVIELSLARAARYAKASGHYKNTPGSHVVGMCGESASSVAFARLLWIHQEALWRDPRRESECDLLVNDIRLEVKTRRSEWWEGYGRGIATTQIASVRAKADVVLWGVCHIAACRTEADVRALTEATVTFMGYSLVADFDGVPAKETGTGSMPRVWNHEAPFIRNLDELHRYAEARGERQIQAIGRDAFGLTYAPENGAAYESLARVVEGRLQGRSHLPVPV